MKRILVLSVLLGGISLSSLGQHIVGAKLNVGMSRISDHSDTYALGDKILFAPSGQAGLFYNFEIGERSMVGAELLFLQMEGKFKDEGALTDMYGNQVGSFTAATYRNLSYIGLPVYYGFRIKKFNINLGGQASILVTSSYLINTHIKEFGGIEQTVRSGDDLTNIVRFDFGPRAGLFFDLSEKFALEANYYFGLNNIRKGDLDITTRNQQLTVGLRYKFLHLPKNS